MNQGHHLEMVIMTRYNHVPYIDKSILSVLNQIYPNIELLLNGYGSI